MTQIDEHVFSYGILSDDHVAAAKEIANVIEQYGHPDLAEVIRTRFKIKQIPTFDIEQTKFHQYALQSQLPYSIQGMVREGFDTTAINYPVVSITGDIRKFEKLVNNIQLDAENS